MAAPWIKLQIEFSGAAFPLFISAVSPSEAPLQAIYGALFLGKLITWAQPGRSSTHRPALSHLGWNCSDTPNQSWSGKGSSPEQPHPCTSWPLTPVNTRHYSDHNCIRFFTACSKTPPPWIHLLARALIRYCWFMYLAKLPYWPCSLTFY